MADPASTLMQALRGQPTPFSVLNNPPPDPSGAAIDYANGLQPQPVYSGAILPLTRYDDGSIGMSVPTALKGAAESAYSGFTAPGDALAGRFDPTGPDGIKRAMDFAGLATLGPGLAPAEEGALNMGLRRAASDSKPPISWNSELGAWEGGDPRGGVKAASLEKFPDLFNFKNMDEVPNVPQSDLTRYTPAKGTSERVQDLTSNPQVRQQMLDVIRSGLADGGVGKSWYNTDELRQQFLNELGPEQGPQAFGKFMDYVAATSPRNPVPTNIKAASYYYWRDMNGLPPLVKGETPPPGYGSVAQGLHVQNAGNVANGTWDPLQNPKPISFSANLQGNQSPVTVDTHAFRLPAIFAQDPRFLETGYQAAKDAPKQNIRDMVTSGQMSMDDAAKQGAYWNAMPAKNEYGAMEQYYKGLADELGISPAQAQAAAWVGGGKLTGLSSDEGQAFMHTFQDRLKHTADRMGSTPQDVLSNVIRGQHPLLMSGPPGLPLGTGQAYQQPQQPPPLPLAGQGR